MVIAKGGPRVLKKKKPGIIPDILGFDDQERIVRKVEMAKEPPYLVEPPYIEGNLEGAGPFKGNQEGQGQNKFWACSYLVLEGKATSVNVDSLLRQILSVKIFRVGAKRTCADYPQLVYILLISI